MRRSDTTIYDLQFLKSAVRAADDEKYMLAKILYELGGLSYEKSSWKGDYELHDMVKQIRDYTGKYYNMVKLFENGKRGDHKAYEDILIFFLNSYIDTFILRDKVQGLKDEIAKQKADIGPVSVGTNGANTRSKSEYVTELENRLENYEMRINTELVPLLNRFLDHVNQILLCEKIKLLIEQSLKNEGAPADYQNIRNLEKILITFLWLHIKISGAAFSSEELNRYILETFQQIGLFEGVSAKTGITVSTISDLASKISGELAVGASQKEKESGSSGTVPQPVPDHKDQEAVARMRLEEVIRILQGLSVPGVPHDESPLFPEYMGIHDLGKRGSKRSLFNVQGSSEVSLREVADYMNSSLIFIFDWVHRELRENVLSREFSIRLVKSMENALEFAKAYATALVLSAKESNRNETFFGGEIRQYIPVGLAGILINRIEDTCEYLDEAFAGLYIYLVGNSSRSAGVFVKKLDIVHASFRDARAKIRGQIRQLKILPTTIFAFM